MRDVKAEHLYRYTDGGAFYKVSYVYSNGRANIMSMPKLHDMGAFSLDFLNEVFEDIQVDNEGPHLGVIIGGKE